MGRPSKLTAEVLDLAIKLVRDDGVFVVTACQALGIREATWYEWLARGNAVLDKLELTPEPDDSTEALSPTTEADDQEALYARFALEITQALAFAEVTALRRIRKGGGGWQGSAWYLQRRFPERYGDQVVAGNGQDDALKRLVDAIRGAREAASA